MKINAKVFRTKMIGGGTSYDVLMPTSAKTYQPISGHCYATICVRDGAEYYEVANMLRTPDIDALPALTTRRIDAFSKLSAQANRLALAIAKRAFPELRPLSSLPSLWAQWTEPHAVKTVTVNIRASRIQ